MSYQKHVILILRVIGANENDLSAYLQWSGDQFATFGARSLVGVRLEMKEVILKEKLKQPNGRWDYELQKKKRMQFRFLWCG